VLGLRNAGFGMGSEIVGRELGAGGRQSGIAGVDDKGGGCHHHGNLDFLRRLKASVCISEGPLSGMEEVVVENESSQDDGGGGDKSIQCIPKTL